MALDWYCQCGKLLTALQPSAASEGSVVLSSLVDASYSSLPPLQRAGRVDLPAEFLGLPLKQFYAELDFLHDLQAKFGQHYSGMRSSVSRAESMGLLLLGWPHSFHAYLQKWASRYFKKDRGYSIVKLSLNAPVFKLHQTYPGQHAWSFIPAVTRQQFLSFVEDVFVPVSWPGLFLMNPDKAKRLDRGWLRSFFLMTDRAEPSQWTNCSHSADSGRHKLVRSVADALVAHAARDTPPEKLRKVASLWPALSSYESGRTMEWLAHIINPLRSASPAHLNFLREMLASA